MSHVDEATILALRDDAPIEAGVGPHLRECATCAAALEEARERSSQIASALGTLDRPVDLVTAKAGVRRRLDRRHIARPAPAWRRLGLGRAAALLLVTAGAASALPWSPLRSWWVNEPEPEPAPAPLGPMGTAAQGTPAGGIEVEPFQGRLAVVVRGAAPGAEIEVVWGDGSSASISAPAGSTFAYASGRAEVELGPGVLHVELPRATAEVSLEVGGALWLARSGDTVRIEGPVVERADDRVRFRVPTP